HTHTHTHTHTLKLINTLVHTHRHTSALSHTHTHTHTHNINTDTSTHVHSNGCKHKREYRDIDTFIDSLTSCTYSQIPTNTHTHTHTHTLPCLFPSSALSIRPPPQSPFPPLLRSAERRVGTESRSRLS